MARAHDAGRCDSNRACELIVGDLSNPLAGGEAERSTPQARNCLDVALAGIVMDDRALAAFDNDRAVLLVASQARLRMNMVGDIAGRGRVRHGRHGGILAWRARALKAVDNWSDQTI